MDSIAIHSPHQAVEQRRTGESRARRPITREELAEFGIESDTGPRDDPHDRAHRGEATWGEVEPFDSFDLPSFPIDCLPLPLRDWAQAEAVATQTPVDLPAMLTLAVVAACCAKRIEVDVRPGWCEPTNIYVLGVLPPGNRKSAVFSDATAPLQEHEQALIEQTSEDVRSYQIEARTLEGRQKQIEAKAGKADDPNERKKLVDEAKQVAAELAQLVAQVSPRLIVDDVTPERLACLLAEQGGRIASLAAEGGGVADAMKGGGYSNSRVPMFQAYLMGHSGDTLRVDRVSRPPVFVAKPAITMALTIQPDVLRGLFAEAAFKGRGLLARFLYSIPESTIGSRDVNPPPMPDEIRQHYHDAIEALCCIPSNEDPSGAPGPHSLKLAPGAFDILLQTMRDLETKLGPGGDYEYFQDWGAKLAGAIVRIAGLLHMAGNIQQRHPWGMPISVETMEAAITIGDYLAEHAAAAYSAMGVDAETSEAEMVWKWISRRRLTAFTKRDVHRGLRRQFAKPDDLDLPLTELTRRNIIRVKPTTTEVKPGRLPSPKYDVNPAALDRGTL